MAFVGKGPDGSDRNLGSGNCSGIRHRKRRRRRYRSSWSQEASASESSSGSAPYVTPRGTISAKATARVEPLGDFFGQQASQLLQAGNFVKKKLRKFAKIGPGIAIRMGHFCTTLPYI